MIIENPGALAGAIDAIRELCEGKTGVRQPKLRKRKCRQCRKVYFGYSHSMYCGGECKGMAMAKLRKKRDRAIILRRRRERVEGIIE